MVADWDKINDHLTIYMTSQAPHAHRTVISLVSGIPEHKIRVISPDIGGGFGGKVPVYPGYVCTIVASLVTGKPVKWIEDRSENLQADSFARDYHIDAELAADDNGMITGLRVKTLADDGAADAAANPSKVPGWSVQHRDWLLQYESRSLRGRCGLHYQSRREAWLIAALSA